MPTSRCGDPLMDDDTRRGTNTADLSTVHVEYNNTMHLVYYLFNVVRGLLLWSHTFSLQAPTGIHSRVPSRSDIYSGKRESIVHTIV